MTNDRYSCQWGPQVGPLLMGDAPSGLPVVEHGTGLPAGIAILTSAVFDPAGDVAIYRLAVFGRYLDGGFVLDDREFIPVAAWNAARLARRRFAS